MPTRDQILERVRAILRDHLWLSASAPIGAAERLRHELRMDGAGLAALCAELGEAFGVEFTMVELTVYAYREDLAVGDLADAVAGKLGLPAEEAA